MSKGFKRSLTAAAVTLSLGLAAPAAMAASNNAGSIFGKTEAGSSITYKNTKTGVSRTITAKADGRFSISSVPSGVYNVTDANGKVRTIVVNIGSGSRVNFAEEVETIEVNGQMFSTIDTSSTESTAIFTAADVNELPLPRNSVAVALLTPGAIQGGTNFGRNLPSFGGSSIGENGYYIDGMDVTNLRTLLSFANLPQDSIAQTQVKSGGYGVEFGRALGGIVNIVTKSGSNDWDFGGAVYMTPDSLRATSKNSYDANLDKIGAYNSDDEFSTTKYNVYGGGPLIEDKLFFFTNIEGQKVESDVFGQKTSYTSSETNPNYLAKLDWYVTEDHLLRFTHINNESEFDRQNYKISEADEYKGIHSEATSGYTYSNGGDINVLSYTGYITDDFTVNAMYGKLKHQYLKVPNLPGEECPAAYDNRDGAWTPIGCWDTAKFTVADVIDDEDERTSWKVDATWVVGDHTIKFGYNDETYDATSPGINYSGNIYYRYLTSDATLNGNKVNGVTLPQGQELVRTRIYETKSATFTVENTAWYVEDSWQMTDDLMVYGGLRGETFTNKDGNGEVFIESDQLVAPRVGFSWDMDGDGTKKLYGTLGQYYIPVAANTNIRATRTENFYEDYYKISGGWNADGTPVGGLGEKVGRGTVDEQVANAAKIAHKNLDPMSQLELIVGYQQEVGDNWVASVKFMGRTVLNGMDDFCGHDGFVKWAADNGHDNFDPHSMQGCMVINPGEDITIAMDLNDDGNLTDVTTPASYHGLPEYKRHYVGLQFEAEKAFSDKWKANFSYVLSRTFGNAEGYVNTSLAQEDAGATQDFDHANFMHGAYGDLPSDRRHQFKAFGVYEVNDEVSVSFNTSINSGTPMSCLGYVDLSGMLEGDGSTAYDYGNFKRYGASSFYCRNENGDKQLGKRGDAGRSNWEFNADMGLTYVPAWAEGLTLQATVRNVFNTQRPTFYDQQKDKAQDNDELNKNYLTPTSYQAPRRVTLSARYKF
jgi:hypothetical protein